VASAQQGSPVALLVGIAQLPEEGLVLQGEIPMDLLQLPQTEEIALAVPLQVQGVLNKMAEQIYFQGIIRGTLAAPCSRCLEIAHSDVAVEMRVVFLPPGSAAAPVDEERLADELDLYTHDGITIDLRPLVRDQVVLAFPLQPLCRPDCAGLCQVCGGNRNEAPCTCQVEGGDPRFALLKQLSFPESS
jgi:uncharacterized protein